jgi:hypothetical protein
MKPSAIAKPATDKLFGRPSRDLWRAFQRGGVAGVKPPEIRRVVSKTYEREGEKGLGELLEKVKGLPEKKMPETRLKMWLTELNFYIDVP